MNGPSALSKRCRGLLETCEGWDAYGSHHEALAGLCGGMVRAGWTFEQALDALTDKRNAAAGRLAAKHGGRLVSQVSSKWRAAESKRYRHGDLCKALFSEAFMNWPQRGADRSALRVLLALIGFAADTGSLSFTKAHRDVAIAAGVGFVNHTDADTRTVRKAIHRLADLGIIDVQRDESVQRKNLDARTRFTLPSLEQLRQRFRALCNEHPTKGLRPERWISGVTVTHVDPLHVVWEHKALGMTACRVWALLRNTREMTASAVAAQLGVTLKTAHNALSKLSESRLAETVNGGRWKGLNRPLDDIAEEFGVELRQQHRRLAFETQRANRVFALCEGQRAWRTRDLERRDAVVRQVDFVTGEILRPEQLKAAA